MERPEVGAVSKYRSRVMLRTRTACGRITNSRLGRVLVLATSYLLSIYICCCCYTTHVFFEKMAFPPTGTRLFFMKLSLECSGASNDARPFHINIRSFSLILHSSPPACASTRMRSQGDSTRVAPLCNCGLTLATQMHSGKNDMFTSPRAS